MNEEDDQLIRDVKSGVQILLEKAEEFYEDVNQSPFDVFDARLCYQDVREALEKVDELLKRVESDD